MSSTRTDSHCFTRPRFELGLSSRDPQCSSQRARRTWSILVGDSEPLPETCSLPSEHGPRQRHCSVLRSSPGDRYVHDLNREVHFLLAVFVTLHIGTIHEADEVQACVADGLVQVREMDVELVLVAHADLAREILHWAALPDVRSTKQRTCTIQVAHRNQRGPPEDVLRLLVLGLVGLGEFLKLRPQLIILLNVLDDLVKLTSRDCLSISNGSHIFDSAWQLSSQEFVRMSSLWHRAWIFI